MARIGLVYGDRSTLKKRSGTATRDAPIVRVISSDSTGPVMMMIALSRFAHWRHLLSSVDHLPLFIEWSCEVVRVGHCVAAPFHVACRSHVSAVESGVAIVVEGRAVQYVRIGAEF